MDVARLQRALVGLRGGEEELREREVQVLDAGAADVGADHVLHEQRACYFLATRKNMLQGSMTHHERRCSLIWPERGDRERQNGMGHSLSIFCACHLLVRGIG